MNRFKNNRYSLEILNLIVFLFFVFLFVLFYCYGRTSLSDYRSYYVAQNVQVEVNDFFKKQPKSKLSMKDLKIPFPLESKLDFYFRRNKNWRIYIWHPKGNCLYFVTFNDIEKRYR